MNLISKRNLYNILERKKLSSAKSGVQTWCQVVKEANWADHHEMKMAFPTADIRPNGRVIFNICNNQFRLIVYINYSFKLVLVKWFGTHKEYDLVDVDTVGGT